MRMPRAFGGPGDHRCKLTTRFPVQDHRPDNWDIFVPKGEHHTLCTHGDTPSKVERTRKHFRARL